MHHPFAPLVLLGLLPLAYFSYRLGLPRYRIVQWALAGAALLILIAGAHYGGVDFSILKRMKLVIALVAAAGLLAHHLAPGNVLESRYSTKLFFGLAAVAWVVYVNFFSFHGARTYIHLHDVAHYYIGSKYFGELGYGRIYIAMLRAEAELFDNHFKSIEARDLTTNALVHVRSLLSQSEPVKARFCPRRWADFQVDVAYFRKAMGKQYGEILRDHGFNATPLWALIGGSLANLVAPGSHRGILLLCLLDPLLLAAMFLAIRWAFGTRATMIGMVYFCVLFGSSFGWTGGAFLRHLWLFGLVGAVCCLQRGRYVAAGVLMAGSTLLRLFPLVFLYGLICKAGWEFLGRKMLPRPYVRLFAAFTITAGILFALTGLLPRGFAHWGEFRGNMERHFENTAYNTIGLTEILAYRGPVRPSDEQSFEIDIDRRRRCRAVQLWGILPLVAAGMALMSRRRNELRTMAIAVLPIFMGLNLAAYYYVFLMVLLLAYLRNTHMLALMFAVEVVSYTLLLFEDRQVVIYFYRNLLMVYLLVATCLEPSGKDDDGARSSTAPAPGYSR